MGPTARLYEDEWSAETYDHQVQGVRDLPFWRSLAESADGPVLELACGTGRILLPLARAGFRVTGLDASPFMLAVARRKLAQEAEQVQQRCRLAEARMTDFSLDDEFDLIYVPARSLQILPTRAEHRSCLEHCSRHLSHRGRLAIAVFNPMLSKLVAGRVEEGPGEFSGPDGAAVKWSAVTEYDLAAQKLRSEWRYECAAAHGATAAREYSLELHYFFRFEMEWMLDVCGFEVEALYGDCERSEFAGDSPEMVFVARKR
jgi:SAM-dependent methyltransferase